MMKPIWPRVLTQVSGKRFATSPTDIEVNEVRVNILTFVRIKHRGKWYLRGVVKNVASRGPDVHKLEGQLIQEAYDSLIHSVYMAQHFSKVMPNVKDTNGCYVWPLDKDQRDEKTRLENL